MVWIHPAQNKDHQRVLVTTAMSLRCPQEVTHFLNVLLLDSQEGLCTVKLVSSICCLNSV